MFKTDSKTLEALSFEFNTEDISRFRRLIDLMKRRDLSSFSEEQIEEMKKSLDQIGELKLNGKVYAFHVDDTYAARQRGDSGEGIEMYLRQGNAAGVIYQCSHRDYVLKVEDGAIDQLRKRKIDTIYTGDFGIEQKSFLGILQKEDPDDPVIKSKLKEHEIDEFEDEGIKVVVLEKLI